MVGILSCYDGWQRIVKLHRLFLNAIGYKYPFSLSHFMERLSMSSKKVILTTLGILTLNLSVCTAQAAGPTYSFTNTFDTAVIDGSYTEWNPLGNNVHVPMYIAGNPTKPQLSDLYLRYDCQNQTISALVLKLPNYSVVGNAWIKIYELGNSPRVDESYNPPNGIQPEFSWVPPASSV